MFRRFLFLGRSLGRAAVPSVGALALLVALGAPGQLHAQGMMMRGGNRMAMPTMGSGMSTFRGAGLPGSPGGAMPSFRGGVMPGFRGGFNSGTNRGMFDRGINRGTFDRGMFDRGMSDPRINRGFGDGFFRPF
jgi:hypothetical protein